MSSPSSRMLPEVGRSKPAIIRSVVVFPQPEEPSSEKNSPPSTCRSIPSTAVTPAKRLVSSTSVTSPAAIPLLLASGVVVIAPGGVRPARDLVDELGHLVVRLVQPGPALL